MFEKEMKNPQGSIAWSEVKLKREKLKSFYPTILKAPIIYGTKNKLSALKFLDIDFATGILITAKRAP